MKTLLSGRRFAPPQLCACAAAFVFMTTAGANAKTVNVDGNNFTTLSAAVADAYSDADPAVINLLTNSLPAADGQVILNRAIVINGDADNDGNQCDLLADMPAIKLATVPNVNEFNAYITVMADGIVNINNLRVHPNEDGNFNSAGTERERDRITGIRLMNPANSGEIGNYTLTKVYVSGSDINNTYVALDTGADLFNQADIKRWGGHNGNVANNSGPVGNPDGAYSDDAAIQIENGPGLGTFNSTLDHCHAGLSRSAAFNLLAKGGVHNVYGGIFGHCARDGIRVEGTSVTIEGTASDRVRVLRNTNIPADNSHSIEVVGGADLLSLRYVDVAGLNTANNFNFRGGSISVLVEYCRGMGKFTDVGTPANQTVFIDNTNTMIGTIQNCTFHGLGSNPSPFTIDPGILDEVDIKNCIFTSANLGTLNINSSGTLTNCALPTDGVTNESLAPTPTTGTGATFVTTPVSQSPLYQETLADYDWSDAQGGDGNADVLRPGNSSAYAMAAEGNTPLVGGASGTEVPVSLSGFTIE